jgi:hypothetical protein
MVPTGQILAEVPFRTTQDCIVVDGSVNGHPVSLLFDSGFGGTILLNSGIDVGPVTGKIGLRDFVGQFEASTVTLKSLQVGSFTLHPDEAKIVEEPQNFSEVYGVHMDGILGLGAVKNLVTEINLQKSEFIFHAALDDISVRQPDNKKSFLVKMLPLGGNSIQLPVTTTTGETMTMALDTGNAFYATTHRDVLERFGIWPTDKKPEFVRESAVASGAVDSWTKKMPPLTIFGVPVGPTLWDVLELPSSDAQGDGTVGFGFLSNFNITFDYQRRRVWFENWRTPIENPEMGDVGISAHYDHDAKRVVISLVSPGSPADQDGIKEDDQLLSLDGADLDHPSMTQLRKMLEGPIGSPVSLGISHKGNYKRYTLVRRSLVN